MGACLINSYIWYMFELLLWTYTAPSLVRAPIDLYLLRNVTHIPDVMKVHHQRTQRVTLGDAVACTDRVRWIHSLGACYQYVANIC